jgi:hypothetical protein
MNKLIIDATTGTVLHAKDCFIVDYDKLSDDDKDTIDYGFSDAEIGEVAVRRGVRVQQSDSEQENN